MCRGRLGARIFRTNYASGNVDSFSKFHADLVGTNPVTFRACSDDPTPQVADDERMLCMRLVLDAAGLEAAGWSATLPIRGQAQLSEPGTPTPATFTAGAGNSPVVLSAWATVSCYSPRRDGPLEQQVDGRLEVKKNTADWLKARVVLSVAGDLPVADCGATTSADFDFTVDLARP